MAFHFATVWETLADAIGDHTAVVHGDGVKRDLAAFKAPKRVVFVTQVPRAPNGKADYNSTKQLANDALRLGS